MKVLDGDSQIAIEKTGNERALRARGNIALATKEAPTYSKRTSDRTLNQFGVFPRQQRESELDRADAFEKKSVWLTEEVTRTLASVPFRLWLLDVRFYYLGGP